MWEPSPNDNQTPWDYPRRDHATNRSTSPANGSPERVPFAMTPPNHEARSAPPVGSSTVPGYPRPPVATPSAANSPTATAPLVVDKTRGATGPSRRIWPFIALALATVAGSGVVSWLVASSVTADQPNEQEVLAVDTAATPEPQVVDVVADDPGLDDEPFAQAAEIIRPSVVQLDLGQGLGTGIVIDSDGTILTAAHVVGAETDVQVTFSDGSSTAGAVVGTHEPTDVAVVKVDPIGRELVPATLADGSLVRVGQQAVAVGSPFGFDQTVTAGIVSAVDRIVNGVSMVQTDAPINPGNSGGPLINLQGEVIGINDLIFTESGSSAGVGFAISIDLAVIIADQIVAGVEPQLALLGVSTRPAADGARGAQVEQVVVGSAAEAAGLAIGDVVVSLDGVDTRGSADLRAQVIDQAPGSEITITVLRDGQELELAATLGSTG